MPTKKPSADEVVVPKPDPTVLTTQALLREVSMVREVTDTRFDGMDKAIELLQEFANRSPTTAVLEQQVVSMRELMDVKFQGVQTQFVERDKRTEQLSIADKTAIAAALQAQKEAAGATSESFSDALNKLDSNFTKLIEQGRQTLQAVVDNTNQQISDLKSRLDKGEGRSSINDPAFAALLAEMKAMRTDASQLKGKGEGISIALAGMLSVVTLIVAIGGSALVSSLVKGYSTQGDRPPIVYVPAPAQVK
jgi:hypothetical protein